MTPFALFALLYMAALFLELAEKWTYPLFRLGRSPPLGPVDAGVDVHLFRHPASVRGNFSMFSNLRTEGPVSNHFLLRSNPLKLWSYQEDVVSFIDIDDRRARIGYQYQRLKGNQLPVVEFRKLIYAWTGAGSTIP